MTTAPEAFGYATCLDARGFYAEAALLRRQHAEIEALTAERDALREALQQIVDWDGHALNLTATHAKQARAALQQPTEQSNG